jgi:hypothetical protein
VPLRHALRPERQHDGCDRREPLRHRGDRQRHRQEEHVHDLGQGAQLLHEEDGHADADRDRDHREAEELADAVELLLQRGLDLLRRLERAGDLSDLGLRPGGGDDGPAAARGDRRPREDHVALVGEAGLRIERGGVLGDRRALASEGRLGDAERDRLQHPRVGGHRVALLKEEHVAGHDLGRRHHPLLAVAKQACDRCGHRSERGHRLLGAGLLDEAQHAVQDHDGEDGERLVGDRRFPLDPPRDERHGGRDEQEGRQDVRELREEAAPGRDRRRGRQLVPAVAVEACRDLVHREASAHVAAERGDAIGGRAAIEGQPGLQRLVPIRNGGHAVLSPGRPGKGRRGGCATKHKRARQNRPRSVGLSL